MDSMEAEEQKSVYFVNLRHEEFEIVKVNYDGPFLSRKLVNFSNPNELVSHLVEHQRVEKKILRNINTSESENIECDSEQRRETVRRLEKSTKYRLADIREAIKKRKVKNRSNKRYENHIIYYNSTTKSIEGESNKQWQFQGLDHSNPTKAEPSKVREVFSWLKKYHSAFLPDLTENDTEQTEEDLLCLMRLHMKDESLLDLDFNNKNDYFKSIDNSLEKIKLNPYLILQYQLYTKNAPKHRVKTYPGTDSDLILDFYINRLINLDKLFHRKYPEIYSSIESLDNDLATLSEEEEPPDSPQDMNEELKDSVAERLSSVPDLREPNAVENLASKRSSDQKIIKRPNISDKDSTQNNDSKTLHCQKQPKNVKTALDHTSEEPNAVKNYKSGESRSLGKPELLIQESTQKSSSKLFNKDMKSTFDNASTYVSKEVKNFENKEQQSFKVIISKNKLQKIPKKRQKQEKSEETIISKHKLQKLQKKRQKQEKSEEKKEEAKETIISKHKLPKIKKKRQLNLVLSKLNDETWHCEKKRV